MLKLQIYTESSIGVWPKIKLIIIVYNWFWLFIDNLNLFLHYLNLIAYCIYVSLCKKETNS